MMTNLVMVEKVKKESSSESDWPLFMIKKLLIACLVGSFSPPPTFGENE